MSCSRMEDRILPYVDGRLKEGERREMEAHLAACAACRLRVNEFRAVTGLLDELPQIEPSAAFDMRVHARLAAEPVKQSWWAWFTPSPRVAFAASLLLLGTVWIGANSNQPSIAQEDLPVLENYDVLSNFEPLTELPQPVQADETNQQNQHM
ncbi:MAG TPA: zf-HC2 domain-containing protein [Candidatus Acidoferrum sp.]|nr:zf-HC2 domain-containing protein [Candidatus Acidoferrum sp.]